jgi:hypothetical protein
MARFTVVLLMAFAPYAVAKQLNIPKEEWLLVYKPNMSRAMCEGADSPFRQIYEGTPEDCVAEVGRLFNRCTRHEPAVALPDVFASIPHSNWYWHVVIKCVTAHYQGGTAVGLFRAYQEVTSTPPFHEIHDDQEAERQALLAREPTLRLTFAGLPKTEYARTQNMIVRYSYLARGWWVELRCSLLEAEARSRFEMNVANATRIMRSIFSADHEPDQARKYTEIIQMYALKYTSANKHFGCQEPAIELVDDAVEESQRWTDSLNEAVEAQ